VSVRRSNEAVYVEGESRPTDRLLLQAAGRAEHYTDFGSTSDGKLAMRFAVSRGLALRGSVSTGFRAPPLMQEYLSKTGHNLVFKNGAPTWVEVRTFPVNSPEAQTWGAQPLRPEKSVNRSAGVAFDEPGLPLITVDYFDVAVRDRIAVRPDVTGQAAVQLLAQSGFGGIQDGTYFTNAMDTRSRGIDVVASHALRLGRAQQLEMVAAYNQTRATMTHVAPQPPQLAAEGPLAVPGAFGHGNPRETTTLALNYSLGRFGFNVDSRRSGPTAALTGADGSLVGVVNPHWIPDMRASYQFHRTRVAVSVANLFDTYPEEWSDFKNGANATGASTGGTFRYPGAGTFGTDGRMVSLQVSYR